MKTVGGVLIKIQKSRNIFLEWIMNCDQKKKKKKILYMTIDSNLYNIWIFLKLPNLHHHRCDQKCSEGHMVICKRIITIA